MYSVCVMKHLLERGVIELYVLEEPLLGELRGEEREEGGSGTLCRTRRKFLEVVGVGLISCEGGSSIRP